MQPGEQQTSDSELGQMASLAGGVPLFGLFGLPFLIWPPIPGGELTWDSEGK